MPNRTAQHAPPAVAPRYKLALVPWAGACGVITLIIWPLGPTMSGWLVSATGRTHAGRAG
jgi:hypothetical protein